MINGKKNRVTRKWSRVMEERKKKKKKNEKEKRNNKRMMLNDTRSLVTLKDNHDVTRSHGLDYEESFDN